MKKYLINLAILLLIATNAYSQSSHFSVEGKAIDADTKAPLIKATVKLLNAEDSSTVSGAITDSKGAFTISNIKPAHYLIKVSYSGYAPKTVQLNNSKSPIVNLGVIALSLMETFTDQVTVVAEKEAFQSNMDKQVINVEKNILAHGGSATDVLQTIPSVSVDMDGNVSLKGSTNVKILIDGRQSSMTSSTILEQIPASSIESVELITNPSAKYEAEGNSGIINIITKKEKEPGFNGMTSLSLGNSGRMNGSFNGNYRSGNFNFYGNYDLRIFNMENSGYYDQSLFQNDHGMKYYDRDDYSKRSFNSNNFKVGMDWNISKSDILGFYVMANVGNRTFINDYKIDRLDSLRNTIEYFTTSSDNKTPNQNYDYALNYKKLLAKKGAQWTVDFIFSPNKMDGSADYNYSFYNTDKSPMLNTPDSLNKSTSKADGYNISLQTDYTTPLDETSKFDCGLKANIKKSDANYDFFSYNRSSSIWDHDDVVSNDFTYNEKVFAGYLMYASTYGAFQYQGGLRLEQTNVSLDLFSATQNETINKNYLAAFPSAHIKYEFSKAHSVQLSYSRRINRPSSRTLNPFKDYSDPMNISGGNPDINPEYYNSFELSNSNIYETCSLTASTFYRKTSDRIERIKTNIEGDTLGRTISMPRNISKSEEYGLEVIFQQDVVKGWKYDASFSYFRTQIAGSVGSLNLNSDNYSWYAKMNHYFTITQGLDLQMTLSYSSPSYDPQSKDYASYYASAGLKYELISNKVFLTFRSQDLFNTTRHESDDYLSNAIIHSMHKHPSSIYFLGISYKFNDYKPQKEKRTGDEGGGYDDSGY